MLIECPDQVLLELAHRFLVPPISPRRELVVRLIHFLASVHRQRFLEELERLRPEVALGPDVRRWAAEPAPYIPPASPSGPARTIAMPAAPMAMPAAPMPQTAGSVRSSKRIGPPLLLLVVLPVLVLGVIYLWRTRPSRAVNYHPAPVALPAAVKGGP